MNSSLTRVWGVYVNATCGYTFVSVILYGRYKYWSYYLRFILIQTPIPTTIMNTTIGKNTTVKLCFFFKTFPPSISIVLLGDVTTNDPVGKTGLLDDIVTTTDRICETDGLLIPAFVKVWVALFPVDETLVLPRNVVSVINELVGFVTLLLWGDVSFNVRELKLE